MDFLGLVKHYDELWVNFSRSKFLYTVQKSRILLNNFYFDRIVKSQF